MPYSAGTADAARFAAGSVITAANAVMEGEVERCAAFVRPPSHHAECSRAGGYCLFNSTAAAIEELRAARPSVKVAVFDM